ncbi:MAG TPA: hypothetical protein VK753_13090 [Xanthomonadaceae bacterium]|nr:hypothetical protein [Xanthomonadaceae bacterium]
MPRSAAAVLLYPAQPAALTTLVALSLGMLLTTAPIAGYLFQLVVWAAAYHYAVEVFERSANGSSTAPEFAPEQDGVGWTLLILQMLFSVCLWWLDARVETVALRWLGIAAIAFVQPAMIMTTAMNRELGSAFRPGRVLDVATRLGSAYAVLIASGLGLGFVQQIVNAVTAGGRLYVLVVVTGIGMGGAQQVGGALSGNGLIVALAQFLAGFLWCYATVTYFHLLGATAFAHSAALGYTPISQTPLRPEDRHIPLLRRVEALVADQDFAAAARELGRCLATEPHASPAMHASYRDLLAKTGDRAGLLDHARTRIDALLVAGAEGEALALAREAIDEDPQFRPSSAERTTQLANAADRLGQPELALALLRDFTVRNPRDPAIPANATMVARLLVERHSDVAGARAALQTALDRMLPAHPDYADLQGKRIQLDQLLLRMPGNTSGTNVRKE